jgi:dolichol-phosphate mannosyltransferase
MLLRVLFVTRQVLENIGIDKIKFVGYAFQIEMKYRTFVKNLVLSKCQLFYRPEPKESKMSNSIIVEAVLSYFTAIKKIS